jgi:hypothetical protein
MVHEKRNASYPQRISKMQRPGASGNKQVGAGHNPRQALQICFTVQIQASFVKMPHTVVIPGYHYIAAAHFGQKPG